MLDVDKDPRDRPDVSRRADYNAMRRRLVARIIEDACELSPIAAENIAADIIKVLSELSDAPTGGKG